jgi:hypothetical protein
VGGGFLSIFGEPIGVYYSELSEDKQGRVAEEEEEKKKKKKVFQVYITELNRTTFE